MPVSKHGSIRYLRCVCGTWLVAHTGGVSMVADRVKCTETAPSDHLELIPLPED
ncbi:hypothetical protein [Nocardia terpenica]|nr:hypothetical protein [Nocardia terpenica]NQE91366.1 hypothetical protein [Nocardia terpenica]